MKNKILALLTATAAYSYLFYEQNAGINFLIFNIVIILVTWLKKQTLQKDSKWLWAVTLCLLSSTGILLTSSALSIFANCCSLLVFSAVSFNSATSSMFGILFSGVSVFFSPAFLFSDLRKKTSGEKQIKSLRLLATVCIVFVFTILFLVLYEDANPLFAENMQWLNLDFLSFPWLMFTLGGLLICFGLLYHHTAPLLERWENELDNNNEIAQTDNSDRFIIERQAGAVIFLLLNLMLLILNVGDIHSLWLGGQLPKGVTHTDFVHRGVANLIVSILIASALIMFLFRKNYRKMLHSKAIRVLVLVWIVQTFVMLISAAQRNMLYVEVYNLTYKRTGVFIWLMVSVLGLLTMIIKINKERSNWYVIRKNFALWLSVLSLSALVNWDVVITHYNLNNRAAKDVDFEYLFDLSDAVIPELMTYGTHTRFPAISGSTKVDTNLEFKKELNLKVAYYLKHYNTDWQSWDRQDQLIIQSILKEK